MRLASRLKEWIAYRREIRQTRRAHRHGRQSHDHGESERFHASGPPMKGGSDHGGHSGGGTL